MTHHEGGATPIARVWEVLNDPGFEGMAEAMQTLLHEAMRVEWAALFRAAPGERTAEHISCANDFMAETVRSRLGELALREAQVRPLPGGKPLGRGAYLVLDARSEKIRRDGSGIDCVVPIAIGICE